MALRRSPGSKRIRKVVVCLRRGRPGNGGVAMVLKEILREAGVRAVWTSEDGLKRAAGRGVDAMVVGGGDGTSTTLSLAERNGPFLNSPMTWSVSSTSTAITYSGTTVPGFILSGTETIGKIINSGSSPFPIDSPNSNHPSGALAVFCDGHTMFLKETIAPAVLSQLMTSRSDALPAGHPYKTLPVLNEAQFK